MFIYMDEKKYFDKIYTKVLVKLKFQIQKEIKHNLY